ncbi:MAG: hypothetical protein HFG80_10810 [Eubacterium sp.]|nr:hypothetical protein [Eubacterium sp.]
MDHAPDTWNTLYQYGQKIPFYMTFPAYESYMGEKDYEEDLERMKRFLPKQALLLQPFIEEECDKMEYEGSMMFDEYPDKVRFFHICGQILKKLPEPVRDKPDICELTEVMMAHEIYRRRCRHYRCRRWW